MIGTSGLKNLFHQPMAARSILLLLWAAQPATMVSGSLLLSLLYLATISIYFTNIMRGV